MKERPTFIDQCNNYVVSLENSYVSWLLTQETQAEHKRNKCKCQSCMSEPGRIGRMIVDECERLKPPRQQDRRVALFNYQEGRK